MFLTELILICKNMKSSKFTFHLYQLLLIVTFAFTSVNVHAQSQSFVLELDSTKTNQLKVEPQPNSVLQLQTSGKDPWIYTQPLKQGITKDSKIM